jgi:hypothetical protein
LRSVANGIELLATRVAPQLSNSAPNPGTTVLPSAGRPVGSTSCQTAHPTARLS